MKKKGFTLIELLAVIVILAVIALIATPAVLNIIEDSKKSAAEASARNIVSTAKTYYMQKIMEGESISDIDLSESTLTYDGDKATKGSISYDANGNTYGKMYVSGYCIEIKANGDIVSEKTEESNCDIKSTPSVVKVYTNGEVVYFNVTTGTKCSDYTEAQSNTGVKSGCMKFYAFNDDGSNTINLLLDHNTTAQIPWNISGSNITGPKEVLEQLKTDTSAWIGTITPNNYSIDQSSQKSGSKYTVDYSTYKARLITAQEVAQITGNTTWDERTSSSYFYFDTNTTTESVTCKSGDISGCKYGWLYDRTYKTCKSYGCFNNSDVELFGYWTISPRASSSTLSWCVFVGALSSSNVYVDGSNYYGVRPVITVLKSKLS